MGQISQLAGSFTKQISIICLPKRKSHEFFKPTGRNQQATRRSTFLIHLLLFGAIGIFGCSKEEPLQPPTYPVFGKVTYSDGTPVSEGFVKYRPTEDAFATTTGAIKSDGTYRLTTLRNGVRSDGALPGKNRVTVVAPSANAAARGDGAREGAVRTALPTPYDVQPEENQFDIVIK